MHTNNQTVELKEYPGYHVSEDGKVYSDRVKRFLKPSLNNKGYLNVRLKNKRGKTVTLGLHRLLCMCFKPLKRSYSRLIVNHIDGIKLNNNLENLEWVTYKQNAIHAGRLKLTTKCKPVVILRLDTWDIVYYDSILECSIALGLSKDVVSNRVNREPCRLPNENFVIIYQDKVEEVLNSLNQNSSQIKIGGTKKSVYLKILQTEEILHFDKITSLADYLKVPVPTVSGWLNMKGQPVLPGFIQMKKESDKTPWRKVGDIYLELGKNFGIKPIYVESEIGESKIFVSGIECSKQMNIRPTALSHRLKSNGTKFYDGYRYAYYDVAIQAGLVNQ